MSKAATKAKHVKKKHEKSWGGSEYAYDIEKHHTYTPYCEEQSEVIPEGVVAARAEIATALDNMVVLTTIEMLLFD
jgi:hypothetical protein